MEVQHGALNDDSDDGAYVLRDLISDIPLSADGEDSDVYITCVDAWNGNLYIGTSAGELLHFVSIPPDPSDESGQPLWIIASRLQPPFATVQEAPDKGVKQILILPNAGKACVLCNGTLTFYTLPELSPAFGGKIKQAGCTWVGGLDRNEELEEQDSGSNGTVIVISLKQRLRLIRIGEEARKLRDIELGGVGAIQRRGDLACVADGTSYSLLDVVNQRKNDLFPISSMSDPEPVSQPATLEPPQRSSHRTSGSFSGKSPVRVGRHERNISAASSTLTTDRLRPDNSSPWPARGSSRASAESTETPSRTTSPEKGKDADAPPPPPPKDEPPKEERPSRPLPPNIASPTPTEFLLTTGTKANEPGVGMFVNLDGDVVRGTVEFSTYPRSLVIDGGRDDTMPGALEDASEGYVLALVQRTVGEKICASIEIQRWDVESGEAHRTKSWLNLPSGHEVTDSNSIADGVGLRTASTMNELGIPEIGNNLRLRRLKTDLYKAETDEADTKRNAEEDKFTARFAQTKTSLMLFNGNKVHWLVRSSLLVRLERRLNQAIVRNGQVSIDAAKAQDVINDVRGQEAQSELEFLTLTYIRQKASLLLFGNLLLTTANGVIAYEHEKRAAGEALVEGEIDPRTILSLVTPLSDEVRVGKEGIWISQGLGDVIQTLRDALRDSEIVPDTRGPYGDNLLQVIKRYLLVWRKKKGFGSVADETNVFQSVDAALLHILLLLDQHSPRGPATGGSVRAELNDVVDKGVDCFDRAVELFEKFNRLYVLSRLYQSRKMIGQVLSTWRRIVDGERDSGGELLEGEQDIRRYLTKIRDQPLVQEYGAWLANRNPKLGVQIFADDNARVKFQPSEAVALLKEKAPGAVKDYLEHLVFGKNHVQYVNDLISFYLDTVLHELERSGQAKSTLLQSYETYRALIPPKPTYRQFITDNAIDAEWWHNRLRLLQLIGGSHGAASKYDVHTVGKRLKPYSNELVPEMIILNGREGKHEEALRLLTHGLGDYDTAIRYCLLGGSSIFHPGSNLLPEQSLPSKDEQARLFKTLLQEFFRIEDLSERLERTSELLERFGGWFELEGVLASIPDEWSVELVSGFLVHALRRLVRERNETVVVKALSSAQNLRESVGAIEKIEKMRPVIITSEDAAVTGDVS
jgi:hypothetical protein